MGNEEFSKRLKELRTSKKLTMDQLANKLCVSKSRVNMWENNGTVPRQDKLIELANFLEVTTDYLLGIDNKSNTNNPVINSIQRGLENLNDEELLKAKKILSDNFKDLFNGNL